MKEYARGKGKPSDSASVECLISYLEALNKLFEKSIIGQHVRVFHANGSTIQRMSEGFKFFAEWAEKSHKSGDKKTFLAWQVFITQRIIIITS